MIKNDKEIVLNNLGPIIGDVVGSYYEVLEIEHQKKYHVNRPYEERIKILNTDKDLFLPESSYTDDTVLTCAIYDAIKNGNREYEKYLRQYGLKEINLGKDKYGRSRFGKGFVEWLKGDYQGESYGNGAAMRISPVGFLFDDLEQVKEEAYKATIPSHNNPDAILGAEAVAVAINLLRKGKPKEEVLEYIKKYYYQSCLDYDLEKLQRTYKFSSKTSESVPQAFYIFNEANDFEDAIRKAISIGGDADTIASIVGALAEAYYKVPEELKLNVINYLNEDIINLLKGDVKDGGISKKITRVK